MLSAITEPGKIGDQLESSNASKLIFFTTATDRYNGEIGKATDLGGDVSCVAYGLEYKDPIASTSSGFETFVLNRLLVNPDETFNKLLGKTKLDTELPKCTVQLTDPGNFVCENIYQFTITLNVQVTQTTAATPPVTTVVNVPVTIGKTNAGQTTDSFRITGSGIETNFTGSTAVTADELKAGRVTSMQVSTTVISDFGMDQAKRRKFDVKQLAEFLAKNSYQYTKLVPLPSM